MKKRVYSFILVLIFSIFTAACEGPAHSLTPQSPTSDTSYQKAAIDESKPDNPDKNKRLGVSSTKETSNSSGNKKLLACQKVLEERGQFSVEDGTVDYESGFRIFPLLYFIMTKQSIPANQPEQSVFMKDNPIFVTRSDQHKSSLIIAPIHSKRTGTLLGVPRFYDNVNRFAENEVTQYYKPMVMAHSVFLPQVPATEVGPLNKSIEVNRVTWGNELKQFSEVCKDSLLLPPTSQQKPLYPSDEFLDPFSKEIDFVSGAEGLGYDVYIHSIYRYNEEGKIRLPLLVYCPGCKVENVRMVQNKKELKFAEDTNSSQLKEWLGEGWNIFSSEKVEFDVDSFSKADHHKIKTSLPPFMSENPTTIRVTINGENVEYINH
ncbi:hypothetical protein ACJ7K1_24020 [Paenibacillus elgii]